MKNKKKKIAFLLIFIVIFGVLAGLFNFYYTNQTEKFKISMEVKTDGNDQFSIYYDTSGTESWSEDCRENETYEGKGKYKKLSFWVPIDAKDIRIDFGNRIAHVNIKNINISRRGSKEISLQDFNDMIMEYSDIDITTKDNEGIIDTSSDDPYIVIRDFNKITKDINGRPIYVNVVLIISSLLLGILTTYSLKGLKQSIKFLKASMNNRSLIISLAKNDFKQKYVSSYLGVIWGFIQPLITIAVYWFVFQVGFRSADVDGNYPFILWFMAGIIPWFFFSEALSSCTNVFMEYSYLVKKVVFKIETLPIIKIISTLFVHCFFILFLFIVCWCYGFKPDLYTLQIFYYLFAMVVLTFSITVFTSCVVLFFRDLTQIINIIVNIGFWATPIGWNITMLPEVLQKIFKINPMFYIVTGYRDAFVEKVFFWQRPFHTIYFWLFCLVMILLAVKMFNKLKPHFSDVI